MNIRLKILISILACLSLVGCRQGPYLNSHIESLNAEYRALEDQYYDLEYEYQILKGELAESKKNDQEEPSDELGFPGPGEILDFEAPSTEFDSPSDQSFDLPEKAPNEGADNSSSSESDETSDQSTSTEDNIDPQVTYIFLNPKLTGGENSDGSPGDEGISVVIEPRNSAGQYLPLAGAISVVLLDPAEDEKSVKVARWDFTAQETESSIKRASLDKGIHLKMPWPDKNPSHSKLRLYVRYETIDGRKLDAERDIFIRLPGQFSQRWTPRPAGQSDTPPREKESYVEQKTDLPTIVKPQPRGNDLLPPSYRPPSSLPSDPQKIASPIEKERWAKEKKPSARPAWSPYR